ncbi:hypothetical protein DSM104329_00286 [Capillimicrobium parvum]|uniref:Uncharacterized protein n=1 Tax=Capillimicrobium parvum TaxID=2884022 RepID=A0A9E6XST7_9ACTN|nr:hypothetical protein DSM104329_00286 [Capillimicrobium parvum]
MLAVLAALEGLHELTGFGGHALVDNWLHNAAMVAATGLCIARAVHDPHGRGAWLAFGAALGLWTLGDLTWTILYGADPDPPYPTIADALWLAWYPVVAVAIGLLIRTHVTRFELHRWMDGLAVMLIVLIPGFAFVVQPVSESTDNGSLSTIVDFSYPILDVVLVGALLGVFSLLAWRPSRAWLALGLGCALIAISDAALAVQQARGEFGGDWTFTLTVGAIVITYAAWASAAEDDEREVYGWRAIALAVAAQVLAGAIQIYGLFHELGPSERVVTLAVLAIATTQIIITRPRPPGDA